VCNTSGIYRVLFKSLKYFRKVRLTTNAFSMAALNSTQRSFGKRSERVVAYWPQLMNGGSAFSSIRYWTDQQNRVILFQTERSMNYINWTVSCVSVTIPYRSFLRWIGLGWDKHALWPSSRELLPGTQSSPRWNLHHKLIFPSCSDEAHEQAADV
jgi:hypothetical protein